MRILSIVLLFLFTSCSSGAQHNKEVLADEFEQGLHVKEIQLLDVRTAAEYRNGHIKGSLQANWNNQQEFIERVEALDKTKPVYIYCMSGPRSEAAGTWLRSNGFSNVVELKGGFMNWKRMGKPFEGMPDVQQMTMEDYTRQIAGKEYVLVDFGAEWCPPCKKMEPIVNEFLGENKNIAFVKIDAGIHTDLMKQLKVEGLPVFVLLKNGQEVWRYKGVLSKEELNQLWLEKK